MADNEVILITGTNRGIGKGLVSTFLQRSQTTVIAGVRDESSESSNDLRKVVAARDSLLIVIKIDSLEHNDPATAVEILKTKYGIQHLDVVIANAGIASLFRRVLDSSPSSIQDHLATNAISPIVLLQATVTLLKNNRSKRPRFIAISSAMASLSQMKGTEDASPIGSPYGASKAALNWFIRATHFEERWLTCLAVHPGFVDTDMVRGIATSVGSTPKAMGAISIKESVTGICRVVDSATREISGTFLTYENKAILW
jgi:norsolorinic acid ketoreductase